ncbi:hypothetical protein AVEN_125191-1 [Araneus ventricosus]|uniref:Uncharacterized protein n=1 Tax=Araneus ventricosus TaxID=182803 RepID=A0A4Y2RQQ1_ARAVE|nr:hypothetical protein AVEN_125191-1 [Araneus ventricosus]
MKIPKETTISRKAIYFQRLKNRPERIVLLSRENAPREREKTARRSRVWPTPALQHIVYNSGAIDQAATARTRSCGRILRTKSFTGVNPEILRIRILV